MRGKLFENDSQACGAAFIREGRETTQKLQATITQKVIHPAH
jgi:hypothetical protein